MAGINILAASPELKKEAKETNNAFVAIGEANGTKLPITVDFAKAHESSTGKTYTMFVDFRLPNGRRVWGNFNIQK